MNARRAWLLQAMRLARGVTLDFIKLSLIPSARAAHVRGAMADVEPAPKPRRQADALPLPDCVALVLQGGGALGSYQAGVIEGLASSGIEIDWVAGISIGAVNAAIFAGNPPAQARRDADGLLGHGDRIAAELSDPSQRSPARMAARMVGELRDGGGRAGLLHAARRPADVRHARHARGAELLRFGAAAGDARFADRLGSAQPRPGAAVGRRGRCRKRQFQLFRHHARCGSTRATSWRRARCRRGCRRSRSTGAGGGTAGSSRTRR